MQNSEKQIKIKSLAYSYSIGLAQKWSRYRQVVIEIGRLFGLLLAGNLRECWSNILEAVACREALALAQDLQVQKVVVISDCKGLISDIHGGTGGVYLSVIKEISLTSSVFDSYSFISKRRSASSEALCLARHSLSLDQGRHMWLLSPHDPSCIPLNYLIDQ